MDCVDCSHYTIRNGCSFLEGKSGKTRIKIRASMERDNGCMYFEERKTCWNCFNFKGDRKICRDVKQTCCENWQFEDQEYLRIERRGW